MVPEHNDERWLNEDRAAEHAAAAAAEGAAGQQQKGKKQGNRRPAQVSQAVADMPLNDLMKWAASFVTATAGGAAAAAAGTSKGGKQRLPLQLASNLVLESLGRVEFVHPGFHNDKFIFPVGFAVRRRAKTPSSGNTEIWHRAEIVEDTDGSGPLFR